MKTTTLPRWAADIVANPPCSPNGIHNWFFRCARALHKCGRSEIEIRKILENAAEGCGRFVAGREISDAIRNSRSSAFQPVRYFQAWPAVNQEQRSGIIAKGKTLADLWERSPVRLDDNRRHTEALIDVLFPGNPLLCCGKSNSVFMTKPRSEWRGQLRELALIVPSLMTARTGHTQDGKESAHALSNTGPRRFLVVEQDTGTVDQQAALLLHLAQQAPLAIAVHSGNRSIHGWFYCAGQAEERLREFMSYAVSLGADTSTWMRSQFVRLPDGTRENGKRQTIYFFNPRTIKDASRPTY
jgi:hypothetical protein